MRKKAQDAIKLFVDFQKKLSGNKVSSERMYEELQMMRFRIRPLQGDISSLNFKDKDLIEILWRLGKLDEFFQQEHGRLSSSQRKTFFQLFDDLHQQYQERLGALNLKSDEDLEFSSTIEMEIYKEERPHKKTN